MGRAMNARTCGFIFCLMLACALVIPGLVYGLNLTLENYKEVRDGYPGLTLEGPALILLSLSSLTLILWCVL